WTPRSPCWHGSAATTSKTRSCASCTATTPWRCWHEHTCHTAPARTRLRLSHPVAQRGHAFLEGGLPDHCGSRPDRAALPAGLRPRARGPGTGVWLHSLHLLPHSGADDDEHAAKRICQSVVLADTKPHHGQSGV